MSEINLNEDEMRLLQKHLNNGIEPPEELAKKLFPSLYESIDFKTLKSSKIPTIEYAGKRSKAAILNEASLFGSGSPLQIERCFDGGKIQKGQSHLQFIKESGVDYKTGWRNLIVQGDNLQFLKTCYLNQDPIIKDKVKGKVKLIYIDPPFATEADFRSSEGAHSYRDKISGAEFIESLRERLIFLREIVSKDGAIFVHLDMKRAHYIKVIMDEIFNGRMENEIIWHYPDNFQGNVNRFPNNHNLIYLYSMSENTKIERVIVPLGRKVKRDVRIWDKQSQSLVAARDNNGNIIYKEFDTKYADDVWEIGQSSVTKRKSSEYIDYPTQKPEELLRRVVKSVTRQGDLVMDVFAGSGTTAAVAEKLGRRWIMCDFGKHAIYTIQKRMLNIADSQKLGLKDKKKKVKYDKPPRDFCVASVGAFDFSKIMHLRENSEAYISFVLGIFGITDRDKDFSKKYKLNNVYAEKDGNPVEVYPIWDDDYLKNIRIDAEYLKEILNQSGGKLKGDYYIISPETCVRTGDVTMKNVNGKNVNFKMLTFPYKILEDVSRNFSIEEQPSSQKNINNLISSVGFYFNEKVAVEARKSKNGFKITKFKTSITDKEENRYKGLDGLAMILIDSNYNAKKGFTVDTAVYQKDIKDGEVAAKDISKKSAVIAIDKHGNESAIVAMKNGK